MSIIIHRIYIIIFVILFDLVLLSQQQQQQQQSSAGTTADNFLQPLLYKYSDSEDSAAAGLSTSQFDALLHSLQGDADSVVREWSEEQCSKTSLQCNLTTQCLDTKNLLNLIGLSASSNSALGVDSLLQLCPALLYQSESKVCSELYSDTSDDAVTGNRPTTAEIWGYGILCITIISVTSVLGALLFPLMKKSFYTKFLHFLIGLAVGSLCGSAIFHLIPQAFDLLVDGHGYLGKSLMCVAGIYLFFITEHLMKLHAHYKKHHHKHADGGIESTAASFNTNGVGERMVEDGKLSVQMSYGDSNGTCIPANTTCTSLVSDDVADVGLQLQAPATGADGRVMDKLQDRDVLKHICGHDHEKDIDELKHMSGGQAIAAVAWMIIFGDGLHNFIDGLGIGAAMTDNILAGVSLSIAVFCEEFPHELGDFAVLLNSGMSMKQAIGYNFLSACTCYIGLFVGILVGGAVQSSTFYIFALAAGMFLYISLVDMVPELNTFVSGEILLGRGLQALLLVNAGLMLGFILMYLTALYGSEIQLGQ